MFEAIGVFFILVIATIIGVAANYECEHTDKYHGFGKYKKRSKKIKQLA